jgi:hypothetical protein
MATGQRECISKLSNFGQDSNSDEEIESPFDDSDLDKNYVPSDDAIQPNNHEVNYYSLLCGISYSCSQWMSHE